MIFGPLFMILFLAVLIAVVVLLVRWLGGPLQGTMPSHHTTPRRTPLDILKKRFARSTRTNSRSGAAFSANRLSRLAVGGCGSRLLAERRSDHAKKGRPCRSC